MKQLIDKLNYYREQYYNYGKSIISDKEYDKLYEQLEQLEKTTGIIMANSPTQNVGAPVLKNLLKVKHSHKLLSLDKTKDIKILNSFINNRECVLSLKMDGLTVLLTYENGILIQAETRGNGEEGQLITEAAKQFTNIPLQIPYKEHFEIEGEAIILLKDFQNMKNAGYATPRNLASGSLSLLDTNLIKQRKLHFIAWKVYTNIGETYVERFNKAQNFGFTIVPYLVTNFLSDDIISELKIEAQKMSYPIDGLVCSYNNIQYGLSLGETTHAPKHSLAFKFYDEVYETRLKDVEWSMGRTGKLTPVAIFNPIDIDGTEVNRASLHNISIMEELGIKERGQLLEVFKSNMIIPQVKRIVPEMTSDVWMPQNIIHIPEVCPICGSPTKIIQENDSKVLYCDNPNCEGKLINRIEHFFSKKGLDVKGLSKATIEKLMNWGWVNGIADIFTLSKYETEWKNKAGFGEKSVDNILSAIKEGCNTNLESIISAAGIPLIGRTVARELAKRYQTYDSFKEDITGSFDFSSLDGFGYEMNKSLKNYNYKELDYIVENFLILNNKIEENKEQNLKDLIFCITGKTHLYKNRAELQKEIEDKGGRVVSSISSKVNYLINNDINSTSTKNRQAKELNIPILSEEEFKVKFI